MYRAMDESPQQSLADHLSEQLSPEQRVVLAPQVELVEACPGAGKTRAVVARFVQEATSGAGAGVALLSFTNAAIDEARRRCADTPHVLRVPHFVGTFDTFLHRYIVTPDVTATTGVPPRYFQSWAELTNGQHIVRLAQKPGTGIELSRFGHSMFGGIELVPETLPSGQRSYFDKLSSKDQKSIIDYGASRIQGLNRVGIFDSDSARAYALSALEADRGRRRLELIARRFKEVIVDEFQDCSQVEHAILDHLRSAGTRVVVVADPDQAIYGFRQTTTGLYDKFRDSIERSAVVPLTVNYRSSPVICQLIASLAADPDAAVTCGEINRHADSPSTIHLLAGEPWSVLERFHALCEAAAISKTNRIVLAYRASEARKLAAGAAAEPSGEGLMKQVLIQLARLRAASDPSVRVTAIARLESTLLAQLEWSSTEMRLPARDQLEILDRDRTWIRSVIGALWTASEGWTNREAVRDSVKAILNERLGGQCRHLTGNLGYRVRVDNDLWGFWTQCLALMRRGAEKTRWSTIHGAKGLEFTAVLIDAPDPRTISDWRENIASESRRVFYVGASRAERLLAIHVPKSRISSLANWLSSEGIAVTAEKV